MSEHKVLEIVPEKGHTANEEYDSEVDENYDHNFFKDKTLSHNEENFRIPVHVSYTFIDYTSGNNIPFDETLDTADEYDSEVDESYGDLRISDDKEIYFVEDLDHTIEKRLLFDGGNNLEFVDGHLHNGTKSCYSLETNRKGYSVVQSKETQEDMNNVSNKNDLSPNFCSKITKTGRSEQIIVKTYDYEYCSGSSDVTIDETEDESSDDEKVCNNFENLDLESDRYIAVIEKKPINLTTKANKTCMNLDEESCDDSSIENDEKPEIDDKQETKDVQNKNKEDKAIKEESNPIDFNLFMVFIDTIKFMFNSDEYNLSHDAIEGAIKEMTDSFRNVHKGIIQTQVNFDNVNYCVGYLWRFAPCHAIMVHEAISKIVECTPCELADKLSPNQNLNLVSLGSGPGNDVVGLLSALQNQCMKLQSVDLTLVDKMSGWKHVFNNTVRVLKTKSYENLSSLFQKGPRITTSYVVEDLDCHFLSVELISKLTRADVVLLVKVLSHVPDSHKLRMLTNIENCMKPGTVLIYIDCPYPFKTFDSLSSLRSIYKTEIEKFEFLFAIKYFGHKNIKACRAETHIFVKT